MSRSGFLFLLAFCFRGFAQAQCAGDPPVLTNIPNIRGKGSPSACVGKTVTVRGIVTGQAAGLNGFFLQDPVGDGDPTTSDGIFVLTGSADNLPDPGSVMQVTGKVVELTRDGQSGSVTEIDVTAGSMQVTGAAALPDPVVLDPGHGPPGASTDAYFQALEGMLVTYPASTVVTPTDDSGNYFALRNDRLPVGTRVTADHPGTGLPIRIDTAGGAVVRNFNELDTAPVLTGVLRFDFGAFRLEPMAPYDGQSAGIGTAAAPADASFLSVATLDCLRLTPDLEALERQTLIAKLALAIRSELGSPDIIAVQGVGDIVSINQLAQSAGDYFGLFLRGCNPNGTNIGLLFNTKRINPVRALQYEIEAPQFKTPACTLPDGQLFTNPLFDNPLLRVDVRVDGAVSMTLILNDWRSSVADSAGQAKAGVGALADMLDKITNQNVIVLGDFGQPEDSDALTGFEQSRNFVNLSRRTDSDSRYSVTRDGRSEALDHIFVSAGMAASVLDSGFAHYNADFSVLPNRQDATTPVRASDHDSAFVHLQALP